MNASDSKNPLARTTFLHLSAQQWLGFILLGHLLLAFVYSLTTPPWEAHDEWAHYRYAAYIAENLALPDPGQRLTTEFTFDEASQPPLYYLLAAIPMFFVETADGYTPQVNPHINGENAQTGLNMAVHDPEIENFPWRGTILALHLGRFISIFISLLALLATYHILRYLSPERIEIALIGTAIQAFTPQFVFLSAVITNDILNILLSSLLLLISLRLIEEGPRPRLALYASLIAGLALLTKYLALAVAPLTAIAFLWGAWRHRRRQHTWRQAIISLSIFAAILIITAGSLLWRNFQLTGVWIPRDPVSQQSLIIGIQRGDLDLNWDLVPQALRNGFYTYWASFGWGNLSPDEWVYSIWTLVILIGVAGMILWLRTEQAARARRLVFLLLLFIIAAVSFPLLRETIHESPFLRGRYMLATLPIAVWGVTQGWAYLSGRFRRWTLGALVAWSAGLSIYLLFFLLMPAYAAPDTLDAPPEQPIPIHARFDDAVELISADIWPADEIHANQGLAVTLVWRVLARSNVPYSLKIQLEGAGKQPYGSLITYPGHGNAATNIWEPGIFQETYWLMVQPMQPIPASGRVLIAFFNPSAQPDYLPVFDSRGNPAGDSVRFGSLRISPDKNLPAPPLSPTPLATFGDTLLLTNAVLPPDEPQRPGGIFPVWLVWQALSPGSEDLTLSLQLLDPNDVWVAGADGEISNILLPQHWRKGDRLDTVRWFTLPNDIPPGRYKLIAALYHAQDLSRIPAVDAHGQPLPNNAYPLGEIVIH